MPSGVFSVVALVNGKVVYHSTKPQVGDLEAIEKRAFAQAIRKSPEDADPATIEILAQPFYSVETLKRPPILQQEKITRLTPTGAAQNRQATRDIEDTPRASGAPMFYKREEN